jgi:hypothetical protein
MVLDCGYAANFYTMGKCGRCSQNCSCDAIADTSKWSQLAIAVANYDLKLLCFSDQKLVSIESQKASLKL